MEKLEWLKSPVVDLLKIGISGLCYLLALMGYRLLRAEQVKKQPNAACLRAIKGFSWSSIIMATLVSLTLLAQQTLTRNSDEPPSSNGGKFLFLQAVPDPKLDRGKLPDGSTVRLLDVDSLSDDKLNSILARLKVNVGMVYPNEPEKAQRCEEIFVQLLEAAKLGGLKAEAMALFKTNYTRPTPDLDSHWTKIVDRAADESKGGPPTAEGNRANYIKTIKRLPFAIVAVEENGTNSIALAVDGQLRIGKREYAVPVIANPSLTVTPKLREAIVIQP